MTLLDLATFICTKVNQTEPEDLAACKTYLQRRFQVIWADQLWKDSLFEYTQTLSNSGYTTTSTWLPTRKVLLLPPAIDLVVAVRTDTRRMDVQSSEQFYRIDADSFAQSGNMREYRLLSPAVWEFDVAQALYLSAAATDIGSTALVDLLGSDNTTLTRYNLTIAAQSSLVGTGVRVDSFSRKAGTATVGLGTPPTVFTVSFVGAFTLGLGINSSDPANTVATLTQGQSTTLAVNVGDTIYFFFDELYLGAAYGVVNAHGTLTVTDLNNNWVFDGSAQINPMLSLAAATLVSPKRQRIQLFGTVTEGTVIRLLGKAKAPAFSDDNDEPGLTGCENILLAFAQGDMLQRERQYGKAQALAQEAMALLDQLKRAQVVQQTSHKRFIPQDGYGPEYDMGNSALTF